MSKRKGLSIEEKRQRMIELFYEKKDFYQLKELEKIAPKEKSIVSQSVKEVIQSLVDDNLIDTDKIGTSIYFWSFPSKAINNRKRKLDEVAKQFDEIEKKKKFVDDLLSKARIGRENSADRDALLLNLEKMKTKNNELNAELNKFRSCDPEVLQDMKEKIKIAKEAANRWTENIFSIKSWCRDKFGVEDSTLNKQFEIPEDMDYIE